MKTRLPTCTRYRCRVDKRSASTNTAGEAKFIRLIVYALSDFQGKSESILGKKHPVISYQNGSQLIENLLKKYLSS